MDYKSIILEKVSNNQEVNGIIGLDYVGLSSAVNLIETFTIPAP